MENTIQVQQWQANWIEWLHKKGKDEVRKRVCDKLLEIKGQHDISGGSRIDDGFMWDPALEPNEENTQWRVGGDCTLCRKVKFCNKRCRANRLLTRITTPILYQWYIEENPEAIVERVGDPKSVIKALGLEDGDLPF